MISFRCDYEEGASPAVMQSLLVTNDKRTQGYGTDEYTASAKEKICIAMQVDSLPIYFTVGGTQTNTLAICHLLRPHEAVIAAKSGHINVHETGAIEATGHKVVTREGKNGKLYPSDVRDVLHEHEDHHMVRPRMVYISQPTELGTLYTRAELAALYALCKVHDLYLYIDGARLSSALTAQGNDVFLPDLPVLCHAFYIGGTKCGAMFGEILIFAAPELAKDFDYTRKQRGGLLAKGRVLGVQFDALFTGDEYLRLGVLANAMADRLRAGIRQAGYGFLVDTTTNQLFPIFPTALVQQLQTQFGFYTWGKVEGDSIADDNVASDSIAIRLVTAHCTAQADVDAFLTAIGRR